MRLYVVYGNCAIHLKGVTALWNSSHEQRDPQPEISWRRSRGDSLPPHNCASKINEIVRKFPSTLKVSNRPPPHNFFLDHFYNTTHAATMATTQGAISKKRKFVADGVFYAELNEFFQRELAEEGYSGVEVRVTPTVTDISTKPPPEIDRDHFCEANCSNNSFFYSHPSHTHSRSPRRARTPHPRTHISDPEAIQVPREQRLPLCRQGPEPRSLCSRPVRIPPIQTPQWSGRPKSMLRCAEIYHGERSQGL